MSGLRRLIQNEPAVLIGLVQSTISVATAFGLGWSAEQIALVMMLTQALLLVVAKVMSAPPPQTITGEEYVSLLELRRERDRLLHEQRTDELPIVRQR